LETTILYAKEKLQKLDLLGKGKSGFSYLAQSEKGLVVLKEMHDEQVDYYVFAKPKIELELESYALLQQTEVAMPKLLHYSLEQNYLVKEYILGKTISEYLLLGKLPIEVFAQVMNWSKKLQARGLTIDYFPSNFVLNNNKLYYIDYEHNLFSEEWSFLNWGIYYWLNHEGFSNFLATQKSEYINLPNSGKPIVNDLLLERKKKVLQNIL